MAERAGTDFRVAVFGPDPLLSVTIERRGPGDDLHLHAAGQGVWVSRMVAEMGAWPVLCGFVGGETGAALTALIEALPGEHRLVRSAVESGGYVVDRRGSERTLLASQLRCAPARHEIDDLVACTCAAALGCAAVVLCNPYPASGLPDEVYDTIAANVSEAGIPVLVDLSTPRLDRVLPHRPDLVKCNDWELAEYIAGPVDGERGLAAAQRLRDAGARTVVVTRAQEPVLVIPEDGEPYEIVPPAFPRGFREGCGDAMMGAVAAAWARGLPLREALVLGTAAGAGNFLRHGLGTGKRAAIEELAAGVEVRTPGPLTLRTAATRSRPPRSPRGRSSQSTPRARREPGRPTAPEPQR